MTWYFWGAAVGLLMLFFVGIGLVLRFGKPKKRYQTIFLDADGTLLDFDRSEAQALRDVFEAKGLPFLDTTHPVYHKNNDLCWKALEQGIITREELKIKRFRDTFRDLGLSADPAEVCAVYEEALGKYSFPFPGAEEICRNLAKKYSLYIVTNGLRNVQNARMMQTEILLYVKGVYISEDVGAAKPSPVFFDRIFSEHPEIDPERTLIVGDSLTGDMQGGRNAGIDTCWICRDEEGASDPRADYVIRDIRELPKIL